MKFSIRTRKHIRRASVAFAATASILLCQVMFMNCSGGFRPTAQLNAFTATTSSSTSPAIAPSLAPVAPPEGLPDPSAPPTPTPTASVDAAIFTSKQKGVGIDLWAYYNQPAELQAVLNDLDLLGVKWLRMQFVWEGIADSGSLTIYDTAKLDVVVKAVTARGFHILGLIDYSHHLANGNQGVMVPPTDPQTFADYAKFLAAHFGPLGVKAWEVWNEPNLNVFWKPSPNVSGYAALLKAAYPAIKQGDPGAFVIMAGMSEPGDGTNIGPYLFLTGLYAAGLKNYFDAVTMHPYIPVNDAYWWSVGLPTLHKIMLDNGDADKKIWLTEVGMPSLPNPQYSEATQVATLNKFWPYYQQYDYVGPVLIYTFKDPGTSVTDPEANYGIVRYDGSHKPLFDVYSHLSF